MNKKQTLHQVKQFIGNDKVDKALELLSEAFNNSEYSNEIIQHTNKFKGLQKKERLGSISLSEADTFKSQIVEALLELIDIIEIGKKPSPKENEVEKPTQQVVNIVNSKNVVTGDVNTNGGNFYQGDVNETVNHYLLENKSIKDLTNKLKDINAKLNKEGIDADFKQHLEQQKYELQCEYDKRYKAIEKAYHDVLKFGFTDEELKELQQLFLEGKHHKIEEKVNPKAIEESIKIRKEANKKDADKLLILAKSTAIQFDSEDRVKMTIQYFKLSLKANKSVNNLRAYGVFLQKNNWIEEAEKILIDLLGRFMELNKNDNEYSLDIARTLNNLGVLKFDENELSKAEDNYLKAIRIYKELAKFNPGFYLLEYAETLNNLGALFWRQNAFEKAESYLNKAIEIWEKFDNSKLYQNKYAGALHNLAIIYFHRVNFKKAEKLFLRSLKIRRELAFTNPNVYLKDVALTLSNLASLYYRKNELEKSKSCFEEALEINRKFAKFNPLSYLPNIAKSLIVLANVKFEKGKYLEAEINFKEALKINEELAKLNPKVYQSEVAMAANNLAILYMAKSDLNKAEEHYFKALRIYESLVESNKRVYAPKLSNTQINLALYYQKFNINKSLSIEFIDNATTNLLSFAKISYFQNYLNRAFDILNNWDIDAGKYWNEKIAKFENQLN